MRPRHQSRPPLHSVPTGNGYSPFTRTEDLLPVTQHLSFLLPKPDDEMLMSEAIAFADLEARKWAAKHGTQIVGRTNWIVGDIEVDGRVTLIRPPTAKAVRISARAVSNPPHPGCDKCVEVATYPDDWSSTRVASELGWAASTVRAHRDPAISHALRGKRP